MSSDPPLLLAGLRRDRTFQEGLKLILGLPPEQVAAIAEAVRSHGFTPEAAKEAATQIPVAEEDILRSLGILGYLYARARNTKLAPKASANELIEFLGADVEASRGSIESLFAPNPQYDRRETISRVGKGAQPTVEHTHIYIDLRAVTEDDKVMGFVPVVFARFELDEPLAGNEYVTLQMLEADLEPLAERLRWALEQIREIRDRRADQPVL